MLKHDIIINSQYGFKGNHSPVHALIDANDYISNSLDKGSFTMGIFVVPRKAFNTVDHKILLQKMEFYGISSRFVKNIYLQSTFTSKIVSCVKM